MTVDGDLRLAILEMDKGMGALRWEVDPLIWTDVARRWNGVRMLITAEEEARSNGR